MSQPIEEEITGLDRKILLKWWRKVYRGKKHINFNEVCLREGLRPTFSRLQNNLITSKRLTPEEVKRIENRTMNNAIKKHWFEVSSHESEFFKHASVIRPYFSCQKSFEKAISNVKNEIFRKEMAADIKRHRKLTHLR